ncbi:MAG: hypothetical protein RBU45_11945 [Myxococcota bacterium]|jgi:hypothetical protein|nr:hypothetical protein [Myxococcota bacterium]
MADATTAGEAMGFWEFGKGDAAAKQWIADLGGYGTNAGTADKEKRAVELLTGYCGGGSSWSPAGATMTAYVAGTGKAEDVGIWAAMPADVKNAVDQSKANWYTNYQNWQVGPKGRYFMSYWYAKFCYLGDKAKAMVDILRDYAAMAPNELFADTYSTYFADPAGYNDHSLWGNNPALPADGKAFFFNNILERHPYTPPAATPAAT